ncbi:molybdopterin-guanine dinucleotide biosynthesis protein MobB [Pseudodesulfovibrio tunisiensis]|uniref:molybdopterin-guanine dinucleotide biosynthesis protein MobB n=1 Tax=Pseudodesulfovibrio tunisiensis TaxID=463192 RepID=UPI001FB300B0|nr:molybdopterin-guanine dinucleotide biosynthesis protein MobB [Pseudodesulfovibrio tunisiensis]
MKAISIIGPKNSGKTTLGLQLAEALKDMGQTVAAAKFSHHGFDWQDADTTEYAKVCDTVAGLGPSETFVRWDKHNFFPDLFPLLSADVLIVEGGKTIGLTPRVLCLNGDLKDGTDWLEPDLAIATWGEHTLASIPAFDSVEELAKLVMNKAFLLPGLDCSTCGRENCKGLARDIVTGKVGPEACLAMHNSIKVDINGASIGMKPFVENIIAASVREMLRTLKGYAPGKATISLDV